MLAKETDGRLISFDEAGFTGPALLDEQQPYFVYASHDLTEEEASTLVTELRSKHRLQGQELKAKNLKKRGDWPTIVEVLADATHGRAKVVTHDKRVALAGKFVEYFFEPVLADSNETFYRVDFHRYLMMAVYTLTGNAEYSDMAEQMQKFMRTFDPTVAPDIFANGGKHAVELDRILRFCRGYATTIAAETSLLRPEEGPLGKWTLDLTTTALFSLLFFGWGHTYPRLRLLCDDSKPLQDGAELFDAWVGHDQGATVTDGKAQHEIRGNLVAPVMFGSSDTHPTIQVADLLAGMSLDVLLKGNEAIPRARTWLAKHQIASQCVDVLPELANPSDPRVRVGREILKELARRADAGADPLEKIEEFVGRVLLRFR